MYHKLLEKQIKKYFPADKCNIQDFAAFFDGIHNSYEAFDRDRELMEHSFQVSEKEFASVNTNLSEESELRLKTIEKLKDVVYQLVKDDSVFDQSKFDDLLYISDFIDVQIGKNKQTEDSLSRTVILFKTLLANLQSGVLVENENREILFTNQLFCDQFGIPVLPDLLIGMDCSESAEQNKHLFKDPEGFKSGISEILQKRIPVYNEMLETVDGKWLERDYIPLIIDGTYKGHLWQYTDVSNRLESQKLVQESEERNRLIMDSALDGILILDDNGIVQYWNPQAQNIFGWTAAEMIGRRMEETIIPHNLRKAHNDGMARNKNTGESRIINQLLELPALNKDGVEFPVELSIISFHQKDKKYFCGFIRNISARKNAESLLKLQEEKYRNIIANMNLGLLEVDLDETILFANQGFSDMSGYDFDEIKGQKATQFIISPDDIKMVTSKKDLRSTGLSDSYEMAVKNKNGDTRWWFISGAPNYNDQNELIGSIGIHLDITKQKKLENDLEKALVIAEEASRAKESFLANMSHEIRTPLNAIIGMIRELGREELTPKQNTYVNHSETAARHLLTIVNNILDMSKIEAGEFELENKDFSLSSLISNVSSILYAKAEEKNLSLITKVSPEIKPALIGDSGRVRQILINLLGNSIKFTDKGYVELRVSVKHTNQYFQQILFEISDTGIGMSDGFMEKIFNKFSQEEGSATRKYEGTGLGMTITKQMIQLMGGDLDIKSQKGQGTTITIQLTLPVGDESKLILNNTYHIDDSLNGLHVLLVEDNEMNRFIATQSLHYFGCKVKNAENGLEAIEILTKETFDLILMDIQMPEMDGVEATKYIRDVLKIKTPIIALTANAFKRDIDLYLSIGMNDYVTKPFDEGYLFNTIANTLNIITKLPEQRIVADNDDQVDELYDLSKIKELSRGDHSFVQKMIEIFVDHTPDSIHEMNSAFGKDDFETIGKIAHRMKPSIDNMGIIKLKNKVRELEARTKDEVIDKPLIGVLVQEIDEFLKKVIDKLKSKEK